MANLKDVAQIAGVSITTASRVLNRGKFAERISKECAERVRAAARKVGYTANYHARSIKLGRAETIGLTLELGTPNEEWLPRALIGNAYYHAIISGIVSSTHRAGYNLSLIGPGRNISAIDRGLYGLHERRLDGLIVVGIAFNMRQNEILIESPSLPIVAIQSQVKTNLPVVDFDDAAGVEMAVRHLAELGHRNLLWLGPSSSEEMAHSNERERHFMTVVRNAGLKGASCKFEVKHQPQGNLLVDLAEKALMEHLEQPRSFTAVVCYNDALASGALRTLSRKGMSVPGDVSVVGFDNIEAEFAIPPLTAVDHKLYDIGQRAGEIILQYSSMPPASREELKGYHEYIAPELVVRASTGPAPK